MSYELEYTIEDAVATEAEIEEATEEQYFMYIFEMGEIPNNLNVVVGTEYFMIPVSDLFNDNEKSMIQNLIDNDDCFDVSLDPFKQRVREVFTAFNSAVIVHTKEI